MSVLSRAATFGLAALSLSGCAMSPGLASEACDEPGLQGVFNMIEREAEALREGLDDLLGLSVKRSCGADKEQ